MAVLEGQQAEQPVQRVGRSRLNLAEQRLPRPEVRVPQRETAGVPLVRLHLKPGQKLPGDVGSRGPFELPRERQLPADPGLPVLCGAGGAGLGFLKSYR